MQLGNRRPDRYSVLKRSAAITLAYIVIGTVWILFSDAALEALSPSLEWEHRLQSLKGVLFVLVTSGLLWLTVFRLLRAEERRSSAITGQEHLFESIVNDTPDLICRFKPDGTIIHANSAYEAYCGAQPGSLIGANRFQLVDPADTGSVKDALAALSSQDPIRTHEFRVLKDGKRERWQRWTNRALFSSDGMRVDEIQAIGRDITAEIRARNEREITLGILPAFIDALPGFVLLVDADGRIIFSNRIAQTTLGHSAAALTECTLPDVFDLSSAQDVLKSIGEILRGLGTIGVEVTARGKSGNLVQLSTSLFPVPLPNAGPRVGLYGLDLTYARSLERTMEEQSERYKELFDLAGDPIVTFTINPNGELGGLLDFNASTAELMGYTREELTTVDPFTLAARSDRVKIVNDLRAFLESGEMVTEYTLLRKDGSPVAVELNAKLFTDGDSRRAFCIVRDLTQRRKAEHLLREREERYHAVFDAAKDGILLTQGVRILSANRSAEELFGVGPGELAGRSPADFSPEFQPDGRRSGEAIAAITERVRLETAAEFEWTHKRPNGHRWIAWVRLAQTMIAGEAFNVAVFRDITDRTRLELNLRRSEDTLQRAQSIAKIGSWELDVSTGKATSVSDEANRILGLAAGTITSLEYVAEKVHPDDRNLFRSAWDAAKQNGKYECQYRVIVNGQDRWMHARADLTPDPATEALTALGVTQDITEIKRAEQALAEAEHRLNVILSTAPVGIGIESEGRVTWASGGLSAITERPMEDLVGLPIADLFDAEAIERFNELKISVNGETTAGAFRTRIATLHKHECWVQVSVSLLETAAGTSPAYTFSVADITHARKNEERLLKLSTALEHSPVSIISTDVAGSIEYVNAGAMKSTGYTKAELIGQNPRIFNSGETKAEMYAELWKSIAEGHSWHGEFHNRRKNGEVYWERATISPVQQEESGKVIGYIALKQDITRQKEAERELQQYRDELEQRVEARTRELDEAREVAVEADRMKSTFLASVSHELKTPLTSIIGFGQILKERSYGKLNEKQGEFMNHILASADQLRETIDDILDLSRLDAGRMELALTRITLPALISRCIASISTSTDLRGIEIKQEVNQEFWLAAVVADEQKLHHALLNLIANAVKFTPDHGTITVSAVLDGTTVGIAVADTGIGIAPDHLKDIFEEFKNVHDVEHHYHKGTGLGLALTQRLVGLHGGRVWAESPGKGMGSTFRIEIPVEPAAALKREG